MVPDSSVESSKSVHPESTVESANRRNFIRKAAISAAALGVGSTLFARNVVLPQSSASTDSAGFFCCPKCSGVGIIGCATGKYGTGVRGSATGAGGTGVCGESCTGTGVWGSSEYGTGVRGVSALGSKSNPGVLGSGLNVGVYGCSPETGVYGSSFVCCTVCGSGAGPGVLGESCHGPGVKGTSVTGPGVYGSGGEYGVESVASTPASIPLVAKGASGQTANLQEWQNSCGTVYAVINKAGSLGLGGVTNPHHVLCISGKAHASNAFGIATCCINTTLAVHGSVSTKARAVTTTTTMTTTDFAILANASGAAFTVTLPAADTPGACNGMIVFVKKTDSSANAVSVAAATGDTIEGVPSKALSSQYASLTLISNGVHGWFVLSSAT